METAPRKLMFASDAAREALGSSLGDKVPWDEIAARLTELLRLIFSALQELVGELVDRMGALPAIAVIAALLFLCCCCCQFCYQCCCVSGADGECPTGRRSSRPPEARTGPTGDGEEVVTAAGGEDGPDGVEVVTATGGGDGPVVRYRGGGGLFSMHPDKPVMG